MDYRPAFYIKSSFDFEDKWKYLPVSIAKIIVTKA